MSKGQMIYGVVMRRKNLSAYFYSIFAGNPLFEANLYFRRKSKLRSGKALDIHSKRGRPGTPCCLALRLPKKTPGENIPAQKDKNLESRAIIQ